MRCNKFRTTEVWCPKGIVVFDLVELILHYAHVLPKRSKSIYQKTLSQCVCDIIGYRYFLKADFPWNDAVPNEMISNVDKLVGIVMNRIFR